MCRHNRDGSYATQRDRERVLDLVADQLEELGYRHMTAASLKPIVTSTPRARLPPANRRGALGMSTLPFGLNLVAACTVARLSLDRIVVHLLPFVLVILACLMVISYVPGLSPPARRLAVAA